MRLYKKGAIVTDEHYIDMLNLYNRATYSVSPVNSGNFSDKTFIKGVWNRNKNTGNDCLYYRYIKHLTKP